MKTDTIVLVQSKHKKWILDYLAMDLSNLENHKLIYVPSRKLHIRRVKGWLYIPKASKLIIFHQDLYLQLLKQRKIRKKSNVIVFYTHSMSETADLAFLSGANKIVVMSTQARETLTERFKIPSYKIQILLGGVDTKYFHASLGSTDKTAIFVCDYKLRKRPDLICRTVKENPDWDFILHGKNWHGTRELENLQKLKNFFFYKYTFSNSSNLYSQANTFISLSDTEGGPLPAIEALICGKSLILTNTGFAQDLEWLSHDIQILNINPTSADVTKALNDSLIKSDVKASIQRHRDLFNYENFLRKIAELGV